MRVNVPSVAPQFLRSRIGKVCVAIIGSTAAEMIEKASSVVKETPFLEFRLDYLEKPLLAMPKLKQFFADFNATKDLDGIYARIAPFNPDFVKIVPTAKALVDNVTLIRFLERMNDHTN